MLAKNIFLNRLNVLNILYFFFFILKEAEQKRLEEEKIIKTIRKAAEFKANPNPFS